MFAFENKAQRIFKVRNKIFAFENKVQLYFQS